MYIFVKKMIDVLESYNVERPDNKLINPDFPANMHVFKLPELFSLIAMVFSKLKDEKDIMLERIRKNQIRTYGSNDLTKYEERGIME